MGFGVEAVRLDADLSDVPGLTGMGGCDVVSLFGELLVEWCDDSGDLYGYPFHQVEFEEGGDLLVGHLSMDQHFSVEAQDGCVVYSLWMSSLDT